MLDPQKMTTGEKLIYLVTKINDIETHIKINCITEGKVYGILLRCLVGVAAIGGVILAGIKLIPAAIAAIL